MPEPVNAEDESLLIDLKILCNAVVTPIILPGLPATTTVADLKASVQNAFESRPATERMRFIYRGRILPNDEEELGNIFGVDNIRQCREQIIHLVIPDHPNNRSAASASSSPLPRPSTVPPPSQPTATQSTPTNPFRAYQPVPRPQSQPPSVPPHPPNPLQPHPANAAHAPHVPIIIRGMPQIPAMPPMAVHPPNIQAELGNIMNQQIQTMVRRAQAQVQQGIAQQRAQMDREQHQNQANTQEPTVTSTASNGASRPHNVFQQVIAQQQQQRAAAVAQSNGTGDSGSTTPENGSDSRLSLPNGDRPPARPPNVSIHREVMGPNGTHWSFSIDSTVRIPAQLQGVPPHTAAPSVLPTQAQIPVAPTMTQLRELNASIDDARRNAAEALAVINTLLSRPPLAQENGEQVDARSYESARGLVQDLATRIDEIQSRINPEIESIQRNVAALRALQQNVVIQLDRLRQRNRLGIPSDPPSASYANSSTSPRANSPLSSLPASSFTSGSQPTRPVSSTGHSTNQAPPQVFLLSGPEGPYGLVFSNSGAYSTAPLVPASASNTAQNTAQLLQQRLAVLRAQLQNQTQQPVGGPSAATAVGQEQNTRDANARADHQQAPGQPEQGAEQPGQAEDQQQQPNFMRPAALLGHIWLAVRLLFFMYMLSGGPGWRRPLMVAGIAVVIYLGRLGVFNNQVDRARRHFEGLLPLPEERRRDEEQQRRAAAQAGAGRGGADGRAEPTPEETAQRLVREQGDQVWLRIRDTLRMLERAVALFVASLWPGLGERMIAAREERLREQRAQEELRQREEAQRQANQQANENTTDGDAEAQNGEVSRSSSQHIDKGKGRVETAEGASASASSASLSSNQAHSPAPDGREKQGDLD